METEKIQMNWDWMVSALILIWLGLTIAAAVTKQTIPELLSGLTEWIRNTKEEADERGKN